MAAATPEPASFTPASFRPISLPDSAAISVRSLQSPRWPMRNMRPLTLPRPVPSDRSKRSQISWRILSASTPSGVMTPVSTGEYTAGSAHWISRPQALTALRTPSAQRLWRGGGGGAAPAFGPALVAGEHRVQATLRRIEQHVAGLGQAIQQVGVGRVREVACL